MEIRPCLLRPHLCEQQHILDAILPGEEHRDPVDAEAYARRGGHAVFQRAENRDR